MVGIACNICPSPLVEEVVPGGVLLGCHKSYCFKSLQVLPEAFFLKFVLTDCHPAGSCPQLVIFLQVEQGRKHLNLLGLQITFLFSIVQFAVLLVWIAEYPDRRFLFNIPAWVFGLVLVALQVLQALAARDLGGLFSLLLGSC